MENLPDARENRDRSTASYFSQATSPSGVEINPVLALNDQFGLFEARVPFVELPGTFRTRAVL